MRIPWQETKLFKLAEQSQWVWNKFSSEAKENLNDLLFSKRIDSKIPHYNCGEMSPCFRFIRFHLSAPSKKKKIHRYYLKPTLGIKPILLDILMKDSLRIEKKIITSGH